MIVTMAGIPLVMISPASRAQLIDLPTSLR
jgi:hypothetical protein